MGFIRNLASILTLGIIDDTYNHEKRKEHLAQIEKEMQEEKRRKNTPVYFEYPLTKNRFSELAVIAGKQIKRLWIETDGAIVIGTVKTVSGISEWQFKLDFNDYGSITGRCWSLLCENSDSNIPDKFYNIFYSLIERELNESENNHQKDDSNNSFSDFVFCQNCGNIISNQPEFSDECDYCVCKKCGEYSFNPRIYSGERYPGVYWFCDNCNDLLNKQKDFKDSCEKWRCKRCGYINLIDSDHF